MTCMLERLYNITYKKNIYKIICENTYRILAAVAVFSILIYENNNYNLSGFYEIGGIGPNLYFWFFDQVQAAAVLFYLIWPFFIDSDEFDKRAVLLFTLERIIEIVFLNFLINLTLLFFSSYNFFNSPDTVIIGLGGLVRIDTFAIISKIIILILSIFFLFLAYSYFKRTKAFIVIEFSACAGFSILCLSNLAYVHDFFLFFLIMEVISVIAVLFIILNFSKLSVEGAVKYFIMNALAAGLFLMGCLMIYSVCLSTNFFVLHELLSAKFALAGAKIPGTYFILGAGSALIVISIIFKLGGYPFNTYVPDVYEASPTFVIFFLSVLVKAAFFLFLIRLLVYVFFGLNLFCSVVLAISAIISIMIGCVCGLFQNNIKRLFGYASVNQLGFLMTGLSVSNFFSFRVTVFYFFIYIIVSSAFLFVISSSYNETTGKTIEFLDELKNIPVIGEGVSTEVPLHVVFLISVFSMCGLPPLAGFFAKYFLMFEVLKGGQFPMVFFILLGSALSAFYYLKLVFQLVSYGSKSDLGGKDSYGFERGYEFSTNKEKLAYPSLLAMDVWTYIIFYMPLILWVYDVFSCVDFLLISIYA